MQSSVRSEGPRPADIRAFSDDSVRVSREISIVSSRAPTPSILPSIIKEHVPSEFGPGITPAAGSATQLNRWNSRVSDASWRYSRRASSGWQLPRVSQDAALLNSNRESMKALSDFLKTSQPPPTNFMSIPSDDENNVSSLKKRASILFGRTKKKSKSPRLMRLPDSAVAAQTRSGSRHIAISIPMEINQSQILSAFQPPNPLRSHPPTKLDRGGAVTVLKPVAEATPEKPSKDPPDSGIGRPNSGALSPGEMRSLDAAMIVKAYQRDSGLSSGGSNDEQLPKKYDSQRSQRSFVAVSPMDLDQLNNQRPDLRMSDGTIYSQMSMASTGMGHTRNRSSVSTAPSATLISSLRLDLPPRTSSISKVPTAINKELSVASKLANDKVIEKSQASPTRYSDSTGTSPSPPAVYGIAVRGYNASPVGRPQVVKNMTSRSHTSNDLPSPLEDRNGFITRPATAPPARTRHLVPRSKETARRIASNRDGVTESILSPRQSRQEKVRARKLRDIESSRSLSSSRRPVSESIVTPPRNPKRRTNSAEARRRAAISTLSPIMLVANLPPYTGYVRKTDLPLPRPSKQSKSAARNSPESTIRSTHTPPRSIATSFDSDTDAAHPASSSKRRSPTQSLRTSVLETRRLERRAKRNMSIRERDMDARMSKIESDNIMLLQTLGGIARSFGEISRIGRESRKERRTARLLDEEWKPSPEEKRRRGELERMEPVMQLMQSLAPRVSMEGLNEEKNGDRNSEDEYDAMSVLG